MVKSLRSRYGVIARAIPQFVRSFTEFEDISTCYDERCKMWASLGIPTDMLDVVVHVNPKWRGGRLRVSKACVLHCYDQISDILSFVFKFLDFSASRFSGSGPACRTLFCFVRVRLEPLLLMFRKRASANYYHLHGETRWTDKIKRYNSVCATTSCVCEAALEEVFCKIHT